MTKHYGPNVALLSKKHQNLVFHGFATPSAKARPDKGPTKCRIISPNFVDQLDVQKRSKVNQMRTKFLQTEFKNTKFKSFYSIVNNGVQVFVNSPSNEATQWLGHNQEWI
jgi:hypothetical protein